MIERGKLIPSSLDVRETLITYLVNTLQGLEREAYFYIPKILTIPDWTGWEEQAEPQTHAGALRFHFPYRAVVQVGCDADWLSTQLTKLWRSWGWNCRTDRLGHHYDLTGTSPDSFTLVAQGISSQRGFTLTVTSPVFENPAAGDAATMPFAVTPDGPRSIREMQDTHPELFT
jgi:hypothetical protein